MPSSKGSKFLFLQSDLEKENEIFVEYKKANTIHNRKNVNNKSSELLKVIINESNFNIPQREKAFLNRYLIENNTLDAIGIEFGLTRERARQIFEIGCNILIREIKRQKENEDYKEKYNEINAKYKELINSVGGSTVTDKDKMLRKFSKKLRDEDASIRLLNVCMAHDINTIGDLVRRGRVLVSVRGSGKKTIAEAERLLEKHGLKFGMEVENFK